MSIGKSGLIGSGSKGSIRILTTPGAAMASATNRHREPLNNRARNVSNDHSFSSQKCKCGNGRSHDTNPRQTNDEERERHASPPYKRAHRDWATTIIHLLKLRSGGPHLTSYGQVCYGDELSRGEGIFGRDPKPKEEVNHRPLKAQSP